MKISVIIPMYNLSEYISYSIKSVQKQNFEGELEIIIVDDGSTDDSLSICQLLAIDDSRIHVVEQRNSGVSVARNKGLESATGEIIMFVDGDDVISPDLIKFLLDDFKNHKNLVLSCCNYCRIKEYDMPFSTVSYCEKYLNTAEVIKELLLGDFSISACAKAFLRDRIGNLRFVPDRGINEDKYFLFQYLLKNPGNVCQHPEELYGYYIRSQSASTSSFSTKTMDMLYFSSLIIDDVCNYCPELLNYAEYNNIVVHLAVLKKIIRSKQYCHEYMIFKSVKKELFASVKKGYPQMLGRYQFEYQMLRLCDILYISCVKIYDNFAKCKK